MQDHSEDRAAAGVGERIDIEAAVASPTEAFYHRLGEEIVKRQLPFLNDVLRQLVTLSVSLLGGTMFFLSADNCDRSMRQAAMAILLLALLTAVIGMLPKSESVLLFAPYEIREAVDRMTWWKAGLVWGASIFLMLGLILAGIGVAMK